MAQAVVTRQLFKIGVRGVVQGVGFRPFIYQLAHRHNLSGWVLNTSGSVDIEVEGARADLDAFVDDIRGEKPPQARIDELSVAQAPPAGHKHFKILPSLSRAGQYQLISPDLAACAECVRDFTDPVNRRYRYPFTNCTNCGPRFTIIEDIPYDRPLTTMKDFRMCPACQAEYDNPMDRRFHAQPNACPACGPHLELTDAGGKAVSGGDAITAASRLLKEGRIIAIRGLGGYLLACDALNDEAVSTLRQRKRRPGKPLAVMLADMDDVKLHCVASKAEKGLLESPPGPIVLLKWRPSSKISRLVAPGLNYLGVMLPYTPLHHLLMRDTGLPLVMTSGNLSEEPIAKGNDEALRRLSGIADYFLKHNRGIYSRYDDSVTMVAAGKTRLLRKARGFAPSPITLPFAAPQVLATGAEEKNTFCLTRGKHAFLSQHIGDMENEETLQHFEATIALYQKMFRIKPELLSCDMHPDYLATKWAEAKAEAENLPLVRVQHHHAHIASCMVENGVEEPVIGVSFDVTGYGTDGRIWGGEFMVCDYNGFKRRGHLEYLPLPGGAAAVRKPYRTAIGYLYKLLGKEALSTKLPFLKTIDEKTLEIITQQVDRSLNSPLTSSCGRLFDAVSALIGVRGEINYDAQAAMELEMAAGGTSVEESYPFTIDSQEGMRLIRLKGLFEAIITDMDAGAPIAVISARFHNTISGMIVQMCRQLAEENSLNTVAISGGVFQNRRLLEQAIKELKAAGLKVISQSQVPSNDGGVALGQAVIASMTRRS